MAGKSVFFRGFRLQIRGNATRGNGNGSRTTRGNSRHSRVSHAGIGNYATPTLYVGLDFHFLKLTRNFDEISDKLCSVDGIEGGDKSSGLLIQTFPFEGSDLTMGPKVGL